MQQNNSEETIAEIFCQAYGILNLLEDLGAEHLTKVGVDEYICSCFFHTDDNPSFAISATSGKFYCHAGSCGEHGNLISFVQKSFSFENRQEALEYVKKKAGISEGDVDKNILERIIIVRNIEGD